jgi:hypothetical protein
LFGLNARSGPYRLGALAALVAAGGLTAGMAGASASVTPKATLVAAPSVKTVTLVTGDQVSVITASDGKVSYRPRPAAGNRAFDTFRVGNGDYYAIPASALPYVGRSLSPSLFDISALARDGATGRTPVTLTGNAAVPGVTQTSPGHGYLSSTATFSAALHRQTAADLAAGRRPGSTSPFGAVGLDGPAPDPTRPSGAHPDYPLHTLQIKATDITGAPANTEALLLNTDDLSREGVLVPIDDGIGRVQVPAGHYATNTVFGDFDSKENFLGLRDVSVDDLTVPGTSGVTTTTTVDERTATSLISASTPRPATEDLSTIDWIRQDAKGANADSGALNWGDSPMYVNAQPAPKIGHLHYVVQWGAAGPATGQQYRYNLAFGFSKIPANEKFTTTAAQVATVHEHFSADPASGHNGSFLSGADDAFLAGSEIGPEGFRPMPGDLTQYLGTQDGGAWEQTSFTPNQATLQGSSHTYTGGHQYSVDWAHGPLTAGFGQYTGVHYCLACATSTGVDLGLNLTGDSDPGHSGFPPGGTFHLALYRNGASVYNGPAGVVELTGLKTSAGTYRAVVDENLAGVPGVSQSTAGHMDLTFAYNGHGSTLPATDYCGLTPTPGTKPRCQILPALSLNYRLTSDQDNTSNLPLQTMGLNVGHLTFDGLGSHAAITSATVSVSFDAGKTWKPARVIGTGGHYVALWQNPKSAVGTSPELKVTAKDAIGGSISQTVTKAYTIAKTLK